MLESKISPICKVGILLMPGFQLLSFSAVVDSLRLANAVLGQTLYKAEYLSLDGESVSASNGITIQVNGPAHSRANFDIIFVLAGFDGVQYRKAGQWLRAMTARGGPIAGICGGVVVLVEAGLLDGYRCAVHWQTLPSLTDRFPKVIFQNCLYTIDRDRLTCAASASALDMLHELFARRHGADFATAISELFVVPVRQGENAQRLDPRHRYHTSDVRLLKVLSEMEARIGAEISRAELARLAGVSTRTLDKLFMVHLNTTLNSHWLTLRLDRARILLQETDQSVLDIALSCGFVSASHFSRTYRAKFNRSPRDERAPTRKMMQWEQSLNA
ncbi:MAG: GlxA family transcriptional regulator [Pseudorhodoplanes sp.]